MHKYLINIELLGLLFGTKKEKQEIIDFILKSTENVIYLKRFVTLLKET